MNDPSLSFKSLDDLRTKKMLDIIGFYSLPYNTLIIDVSYIIVDSVLHGSKINQIDWFDHDYFSKKFSDIISHELIHFILSREFDDEVSVNFDNIAGEWKGIIDESGYLF